MEITQFVVKRRQKSLLNGDYALYKKQLSRRLQVVRRKLQYISSKGHKYVPKSPVTAEKIGRNHEYAHLILLTAERSWAYAMHMKASQSTDVKSTASAGCSRRHIVSKLHKASNYADELVQLLVKPASKAESKDVLEARAYHMFLKGAMYFDKRHWEAAVRSFAEARLIYSSLMSPTYRKEDDMFRELLSSRIEPSIRYAAYQLQVPRTRSTDWIAETYISHNDDGFVIKAREFREAAGLDINDKTAKNDEETLEAAPTTISWRSRTVPVEDSAIAQSLAEAKRAEKRLTKFLASHHDAHCKTRAAAYDDILTFSQDAVDACRAAIDDLTAEGLPQGDSRIQSLQVTRTATTFTLIEWRVGRNRELCGHADGAILPALRAKRVHRSRQPDGTADPTEKSGSPFESVNHQVKRLTEFVVLYDAILQSVDTARGLPGVVSDPTFLDELDVKRSYFAALRCLAIARIYNLHDDVKNALGLLVKASKHMATIGSNTIIYPNNNNDAPTRLDISKEQVATLRKLLDSILLQHRALLQVRNLEQKRLGDNNQYKPLLIERLEEYPAQLDLTKLVNYPPKVDVIPVKPIFLDVAYNYIEYPGRATTNAVKSSISTPVPTESNEKKDTKKGWFGFGR